MTKITTAACLMALSLSAQASAATTFTTLDNPGDPTFNQLLGITNTGTITGYFGSGAAGHPNQAYIIAAPYTSFTPANLPGSVQTQVTGINAAGVVTGFWSDTNLGINDNNFGFIRQGKPGHYTYLSVNNPLVASTPLVNQLLGINTQKIAVGFYNDANGNAHGYTYAVASAQFKAVHIAGATADAATGINNNNLICGFATNARGKTYGFTKAVSGGAPVLFAVPGENTTQFLGVNDSGVAVGFYTDANQIMHGVTYNAANGQWVTVDEPNGPGGTVLNGINDVGQAVGYYIDAAGNYHGLLVNGAVP
jgi:hypothetical protein